MTPQQPTRIPRPWDSPGKNTGVGCHFLLQCMKVKRESEVAQSWRHGLQPTRLLCPCDFPGKSTGVGCHCLLRKLWHICIVKDYTAIQKGELLPPMVLWINLTNIMWSEKESQTKKRINEISNQTKLIYGDRGHNSGYLCGGTDEKVPGNLLRFYRQYISWSAGSYYMGVYIRKGFPNGPAVQNPPVMHEMWVQSLGQEDPLE